MSLAGIHTRESMTSKASWGIRSTQRVMKEDLASEHLIGRFFKMAPFII